MQLINGSAELRSAIKLLSQNARTVNAEIHRIAVSCLQHIRDHGDWTPAAELCDALPNGQRVKALAFWFGHFSSGKFTLRVDAKSKAWKGSLAKDRKPADFLVEESAETTFGDLTVEKDPRINTTKALISTLERASKRDEINEEGKRVTTVAAKALAGALAAFAVKLLETPEFSKFRSAEIGQLEAEKLLRGEATVETVGAVVEDTGDAQRAALAVIAG